MTLMLALFLATTPPGGKAEELSPGGILPTSDAPARDSILMERAACYGRCPIYKISIDQSGVVTYDGEMFVKIRGKRTAKLSPHVYDTLVKRLDDAGFDSLSVPADCPETATDHPTVTLTRVHRDSVHKVVHYTGNGCAPKVLYDLENAVDEATNAARYYKCDGKGGCER